MNYNRPEPDVNWKTCSNLKLRQFRDMCRLAYKRNRIKGQKGSDFHAACARADLRWIARINRVLKARSA